MIGYLKGIVKSVSNGKVILVTGGVGYLVSVPMRYPIKIGDEKEFYIHSHVREDAFNLFGFETEQEMSIFEMLINVSGVGPKTGLAILSAYSPTQIRKAIVTSDVEVFTSVSGIGKKNAQRIIVELRTKLGGESDDLDFGDVNTEVMAALGNWGFSQKEIKEALRDIDSSLPEAVQVKLALKNLRR